MAFTDANFPPARHSRLVTRHFLPHIQNYLFGDITRSWRVKAAALWVILLLMPIRSVYAQPQSSFSLPPLADAPQVRLALDWFASNRSWIDERQVALTEIPAPPFQEGKRAAAVKDLLATCGLVVRTDAVGNVIGERRGELDKELIIISAHLDTVFPAATKVKVRQEGARLSLQEFPITAQGSLRLSPSLAPCIKRMPLREELFTSSRMLERKGKEICAACARLWTNTNPRSKPCWCSMAPAPITSPPKRLRHGGWKC
jgi:hypothetical protein